MSALSTAVGLDRVSAIVGYEIKASLAGIKAGNLPQRIAVLAEANTANQAITDKLSFTNAKEVGVAFGYGSPAYHVARILRPISGDLLGGIPTVIYPVAEAAGATATVITMGITGTATKNVTHKIVLSGRDQIDGTSYSFVVETDDEAAEISQKMIDAVNAVLGAPAIGTVVADDAVFTSKWLGISSKEMNITVDVQGDAAGITYSEDAKVDGAGAPSIATALAQFGDEWNTIVVNAVGSDSTTLDALEAYNGDANTRTGRYEPTLFKPLVALFGSSVSTLAALTSLTDARKNEMTNALCPAPGTLGFTFEAPANVAVLYAKIAQDTPQTDSLGQLYPDMPTAEDIGDFADTSKRDQIVKIGSSTVKINSSQYEIVDLVTTYHPVDEPATATLFRWVRDLVGVDWNIKYKYTLLENINAIGKTILNDSSLSTAADTISPKRWKGILFGLADQLEDEALIFDAQFMKDSIEVQIGESNPNRFETVFDVQRTGTSRVLSTTNNTQFKFGGN